MFLQGPSTKLYKKGEVQVAFLVVPLDIIFALNKYKVRTQWFHYVNCWMWPSEVIGLQKYFLWANYLGNCDKWPENWDVLGKTSSHITWRSGAKPQLAVCALELETISGLSGAISRPVWCMSSLNWCGCRGSCPVRCYFIYAPNQLWMFPSLPKLFQLPLTVYCGSIKLSYFFYCQTN